MTKIAILIAPAEGHFNPFVPTIRKLIERNHEVVCIAGRAFKNRVEKTGAAFTPMPEKWDPQQMEIYDFFPELKNKKGISQIKHYLKHLLLDPIPDCINQFRNVLKGFPADLILYDSYALAGLYMAELDELPCALLSVLPYHRPEKNFAPYGFGLLPGNSIFSKLRNNLLNTIVEHLIFRDVQRHANKLRKELSLPVLKKNVFSHRFESPDLVLHTSIPSFEYERAEFPPNFHFIGPTPAPSFNNYRKSEWWQEIEKDLPVILINQGTVAKELDALIKPAIEALADENVIVLAVPVKEGEIHHLPANTYTEPFIPFGNILPFVDIMVTNGGFGGTQNALAHGIPVIIAGVTEDKMEVAARLEYTGAGINLRKQKPTKENIKKAVKRIMSDPSYKEKAEKLRVEYARYNAPTIAVERIEKLIAENR